VGLAPIPATIYARRISDQYATRKETSSKGKLASSGRRF